MTPPEETPGTLRFGEPHPAARDALVWIQTLRPDTLAVLQESLSSNAIEGNRLAEVCSETLRRLQTGQPVSDRYLLGLCWVAQGLVAIHEGLADPTPPDAS